MTISWMIQSTQSICSGIATQAMHEGPRFSKYYPSKGPSLFGLMQTKER